MCSLILTYLIPCRLITQHAIPSATLLAEAPGLAHLIGPLVSCIKKGDLTGFDEALAKGEPEFVRRRIFLTLERSRDIALRNLLRKVYLAAGYDDLKEGQTEKDRIRKSRIPLLHFATALRMGIAGEGSGQAVEDDEVECLLSNQIFKVSTNQFVRSQFRQPAITSTPRSRKAKGNPYWNRPSQHLPDHAAARRANLLHHLEDTC